MQKDLFLEKSELLSDIPKFKEKIIEQQQLWNQDLIQHLREKAKNNQAIFIPGNTPSSKNSKEIGIINTKNSVCCNALLVKVENKVWKCSKCNNVAQRKTISSLRSSDLVITYKKEKEYLLNTYRGLWTNMIKDKLPPYNIGFYFIRESRNSWDYNNVSQIICDLIQDYRDKKKGIHIKKWIADDSMLYLKPFPLGFHYNKANPGAIITIMDDYLFDYLKTH